MPRNAYGHGFSLIDLLSSISIIGVLLALAVPSLGRLVADAELRAHSSALSVALARARLLAVESAGTVTVCPSADGRRCSPAVDWSAGWLVFADAQRRGQPDGAQDVLEAAVLDASKMLLTSTSGRRTIRFRADGSSAGSNVTLTLCSPRHAGVGRQLIINNVGRLRSGPLPSERACRVAGG